MTVGQGIAGGKIILMGEHSVVYGQPAIALPFSKVAIQCSVDFIQGDNTVDCDFYHGKLSEAPVLLEGVRALVERTMKELGKENDGLQLRIESNLPAQRGLGSSAAVSVAVVRALYDAFKVDLTEDVLTELVGVAESIYHESPSGLDATTIASGKAVFFEKNRGKKYLPMSIDGVLVVADTGVFGQTKQAVSSVRTLWNNNPDHINPILDRLGELTMLASECLETNDSVMLGRTMNEAQALLRQIDVSDDRLEHLVEVAIESGALGAKLTGGGKGGCMIALCSTYEAANYVSQKLKEAGASNTWFYDLKEIVSHE